MTYNFDPDKWYRSELAILRARLESGKVTPSEYDRAVAELEDRYNAMWERLDGTYQIL